MLKYYIPLLVAILLPGLAFCQEPELKSTKAKAAVRDYERKTEDVDKDFEKQLKDLEKSYQMKSEILRARLLSNLNAAMEEEARKINLKEANKINAEINRYKAMSLPKPSASSSSAKLKKGLVAYYPFNGNAKDESGNGNNGTVNGATLTSDRHEKTNSSFSFDGTNDNIEVPETAGFEGNSITISVWVFAQRRQAEIISKDGEDSGERQWLIEVLERRGLNNSLWTTTGHHQTSLVTTTLDLNKWHQVTTVWNGNTLYVNINGSLVSSKVAQGTMAAGKQPLRFGGGGVRGWQAWFSGKIDDVRIYNRALSAEEVKALYDLEKPKGK
jgi:hypothetical protein